MINDHLDCVKASCLDDLKPLNIRNIQRFKIVRSRELSRRPQIIIYHSIDYMLHSCLMDTFFSSIISKFSGFSNHEERYHELIRMGRALPKLSSEKKVDANRVIGCQSTLFLTAELKNGCLYFEGEGDALISTGLAALMIEAYQGCTPDQMLKVPPTFLDELEIPASLSPNRSNGLFQIHLKMQQIALGLIKK